MLCDYGCGQEAKYQFKEGKWCCSKSKNSCSFNRKKQSEEVRDSWKLLDYREKHIKAQNRLDVKEKKSKTQKETMSKPEVKEKLGKGWRGKKNIDHSERMKGERHPNWNINREEVCIPYTEKFYDLDFRNQIKKEQNSIDPVTKELLTERSCFHHIDYNKQNDSRENLIWLNHPNHTKTNFNREKWKFVLHEVNRDIIKKVMEEKNSVQY